MNIYGYMITYYSETIETEVKTYGLVKAETDEMAYHKVRDSYITDSNDVLYEISINFLEYDEDVDCDFIDCDYLQEFLDEAKKRGFAH